MVASMPAPAYAGGMFLVFALRFSRYVLGGRWVKHQLGNESQKRDPSLGGGNSKIFLFSGPKIGEDDPI